MTLKTGQICHHQVAALARCLHVTQFNSQHVITASLLGAAGGTRVLRQSVIWSHTFTKLGDSQCLLGKLPNYWIVNSPECCSVGVLLDPAEELPELNSVY